MALYWTYQMRKDAKIALDWTYYIEIGHKDGTGFKILGYEEGSP